MTTPVRSTPHPDTQAWSRAAEALELSPDVTSAEARAAILRKIAAEDFLPPEVWAPAVNVLAGSELPVTPNAIEVENKRLRDEVESFAAKYWSLPPADRLARWTELHALCQDELLVDRLMHLESGLKTTASSHGDPQVEEVARLMRELYVLPPRARAVRRAEWLAERERNKGVWISASRRLRAQDPETAALEPEWLARITSTGDALIPSSNPLSYTAFVAPNQSQSNITYRLNPEHSQWVNRGEIPESNRKRAIAEFQDNLADSRKAPKSEGDKIKWSGICIAIAVILGIIRAITSSSSQNKTPSYYNARDYSPPVITSPSPNLIMFTPEQVESFRQYDPKSKEPSPPGYVPWLLAGKPGPNELRPRHRISIPTGQ